LRLAVVSPFVDRCHGTERAVAELLERLAGKYGCEIHLFSQRVADVHVTTSSATANPGAIVWHRVPKIPGPHVVQFLGWMMLNGWLRWWYRSFRGAPFDLVLSPGINGLHADVILVHAVFRRLSELSGENKSLGAVSGLREIHRKTYYRLLTKLERRAYSNPDVSLVAVSERTSRLLTKYFGRKDAAVVTNGVDVSEFSEAARMAKRGEARARRNFQDQDFVLLLIGNDWRVKGLSAVVEAMAALGEPQLHLVIVGEDSPAPFREIAGRLGVANRCHWEKPCADVIDCYAAADVYVSPSFEDSFGLPVAEAMACGLPVITSNNAGIADQIQNEVDGFALRDPRDVTALANVIARLMSDATLAQRIGAAAAQKAQTWSWDRNAAAIHDVLVRAVKRLGFPKNV
jgi:UDP-glucose:(heptosyl)LPS alpha-1,3-glucosyltransferase